MVPLLKTAKGSLTKIQVEEPGDAATASTTLDTPQGQAQSLENALSALASLYRGVERRSLSIPPFSLNPIVVGIWNTIKCEVGLILDFMLIIPINLIVLLRNLLPGKWHYRSFSWPYIKYAFQWLWRGEVPSYPGIVLQRLVSYLLTIHFRRRLLLVRRSILLLDRISQEQRESLITKVDQLVEQWDQPHILAGLFTYGLPVAGFILEFYRTLQPDVQFPSWTRSLALFIVAYSLGFVTSAFIIKRGLMLGGSGRFSFFPGGLEGGGAYTEEIRILRSFGLTVREFPLDIAFTVIAIPLSMLGNLNDVFGLPTLPPQQQMVINLVIFMMVILLCGLSYLRRVRLARQ